MAEGEFPGHWVHREPGGEDEHTVLVTCDGAPVQGHTFRHDTDDATVRDWIHGTIEAHAPQLHVAAAVAPGGAH